MFLDYGIFANNIRSQDVYQCFILAQNAVNDLDNTNIPSGSLTGDALQDYSVSLSKLLWEEWPIPLFKVMPAATTTTTLSGGYFYFDPAKFPDGTWYLEAILQITSGGTASLDLMNGANIVISVSTPNTTFALVRSSPIALPMTPTVLTCNLVSSGTSYTAAALGASLIYVPTS
jgi:hypothetical protein